MSFSLLLPSPFPGAFVNAKTSESYFKPTLFWRISQTREDILIISWLKVKRKYLFIKEPFKEAFAFDLEYSMIMHLLNWIIDVGPNFVAQKLEHLRPFNIWGCFSIKAMSALEAVWALVAVGHSRPFEHSRPYGRLRPLGFWRPLGWSSGITVASLSKACKAVGSNPAFTTDRQDKNKWTGSSVTRWWNKKLSNFPQNCPKYSHTFFHNSDIIRNSPKSHQNIWVTFVRQFVAKNS